MSRYQYSLHNKVTNKRRYGWVIEDIIDAADVIPTIFGLLLDKVREERLIKLLRDYDGDPDDKEALHTYLPPVYKCYAYMRLPLKRLKKQLASLYEIVELYEVINVRKLPLCRGCINLRPAQEEHMECPNGCLHDSVNCLFCRNHRFNV